MAILLNPRVLIALFIAGFLCFTHLTAYRHGKQTVMSEWNEAKARATEEARKLEQARQRTVNDSVTAAATREARTRAAALDARHDADGLRNELGAAREYASQSRASAERVATVATELLGQCSTALVGVSEAADRAWSEAVELRQAWPK